MTDIPHSMEDQMAEVQHELVQALDQLATLTARLDRLLAAAEKAVGIWSVYAETRGSPPPVPQRIVEVMEDLRKAVEAAKEGA